MRQNLGVSTLGLQSGVVARIKLAAGKREKNLSPRPLRPNIITKKGVRAKG
jgi:hypothetical protein